jgi:hypothetical protein
LCGRVLYANDLIRNIHTDNLLAYPKIGEI